MLEPKRKSKHPQNITKVVSREKESISLKRKEGILNSLGNIMERVPLNGKLTLESREPSVNTQGEFETTKLSIDFQ